MIEPSSVSPEVRALDGCCGFAVPIRFLTRQHDLMSRRHVYVDESKRRGYVLAAVVVPSHELADLRRVVAGLALSGQRRVHMKKESDARKKGIADVICRAGVNAAVYDAGRYHDELVARAACLGALIADVGPDAETLIVLEQDDSLIDWDRRQLFALVRAAGPTQPRYRHERAGAEHLLALPDAIAWCWARGGPWRRRIAPAVSTVQRLTLP